MIFRLFCKFEPRANPLTGRGRFRVVECCEELDEKSPVLWSIGGLLLAIKSPYPIKDGSFVNPRKVHKDLFSGEQR